MGDVLLDSFLDTIIIFPFLFVLYILIEVLEHRTRIGKPNGAFTGKWAPVIGGATGLIPLCGFSVMASKLYERRLITIGTLLAVFVTTSDEALLVLSLSSMPWTQKLLSILALCAIKFVYGIAVGYLADAIFRKKRIDSHAYELISAQVQGHTHEHGHNHDHECGREHEEFQVCEHKHGKAVDVYFFHPLLHSLQIALVIFLCNFVFGLLFYFIGEDRVIGFLDGTGYWLQPLFSCIVGIVPNCASSVIITETYAMGGLTFASFLGGLVTNAGLGVLVLFKNFKEWKRNLAILGVTFALGIVVGYIGNAIALLM